MKIKICGLSKSNEVVTSVNEGADFCGFILNYPKSYRNLSLAQAKILTNIDKKKTKYVGVLVNPNDEEMEIFSNLNFDYFQLYGNYYNEDIKQIKKKFGKKIISCVQVKKREDIDNYKKIEGESDIILWDSTGLEKSLKWDFNWIKNVSTKIDKMIAGDIQINNLNNLVNLADIIDVSGALETNKVKDIDKIKRFINEIKKINYEN